MSADSANHSHKAGASAAGAGPAEPADAAADAQDDGQPGNSGQAAGGRADGQAGRQAAHCLRPVVSQPVAAADLLHVARQVAAQQAGKWSVGEQQRWWQHLQAAVGGQAGAPVAADAMQQNGGDDAAGPGSMVVAADPMDANPSGLTHSDRTTHSERSQQEVSPAAVGSPDIAATAQSMRSEGRKRKARPGRGPPTDRSPGLPASPASPGGRPARPTYSLNDNAVHYDGGAGPGSSGGGHRNGVGVRRSSAPFDGDGADTFARRSGGSMGELERRSGGSEVADAAHYAALEEKVQRRLRQNREAAQRSRQRKKAYMAALEAELKAGKSPAEAAAAARPIKAARRGHPSGKASAADAAKVLAATSNGLPADGVLDSLAAAAAVVSGNVPGAGMQAGAASEAAGSGGGRVRTSVNGTLQQALRGVPEFPASAAAAGAAPAAHASVGAVAGSAFSALQPGMPLPAQLTALLSAAASGRLPPATLPLGLGVLPVNGLLPNGLPANGLPVNGLPANGLAMSGLQGMQMDPAVLAAFAAAATTTAQQAQVKAGAPSPLPSPPGLAQQRAPLQPPPDFAAATVHGRREHSASGSLSRHHSGVVTTGAGPPTITSGALGGAAVSAVPRSSSSLRHGHAAIDGLLAPVGIKAASPSKAPPQIRIPWPPCSSSLQPSQQNAGATAAAAADAPAAILLQGSNPASPLAGPKGSEATSAVSAGTEHNADGGTITQSTALLSAFRAWRCNHAATAAAVRKALNAGGSDELRPLVEKAQTELSAYFQLKSATLAGEEAQLILASEHLTPAERPYAWLGGQKASEAAAALIARLKDDAPPALSRLQASLMSQEEVLDAAHAELMSSTRAHAASAAASAALGAAAGGDAATGQPSAEDRQRVDALRELMLHPDRLWTQFLEETGNMLPLRHFALAVICRAEISTQLQRMHSGAAGLLPSAAAARRQQ